MSEERDARHLLNSCTEHGTLDTQTHNGFVDVRTRAGKLIFRLDPLRKLIEWREGKSVELIDIRPLMPG